MLCFRKVKVVVCVVCPSTDVEKEPENTDNDPIFKKVPENRDNDPIF